MGLTKISKGLNLPINGEPEQVIHKGNKVTKVALLGNDYIGMKPTMAVAVGDKVKLGQVLFTDKKIPQIKYTSPGSGKVIEVNRGAKRKFESIIIELEGDEQVTFSSYSESELDGLEKEKVISQLIDSGLWTSIRTRPFGKVANPEMTPHSIFITAMDTNPLAPSVETILKDNKENFTRGLSVISKLTGGKLFLCKAPGADIPTTELDSLVVEEFDGPHPAGLVGTHIHFLDPVSNQKSVWYINAQDVVAIGILFATGKLSVDRVVALAGPMVKEPRLVATRIGACLDDLTSGELKEGDNRIISGSVLSGHHANGHLGYLGRFHQQVSAIAEGRERMFLGWVNPGINLYSVKNVLLSAFFPKKKFNFSTAIHGGTRAIVPIGSYEKVMPLDILPTYLLRSLAVNDVEEAESLGCLELVEEDLALCTFVCPSKIDHGANLRETLNIIEKEG